MDPCVRVWSREIGEGLKGSKVAEAFEAGAIVVSHETVEEGVAIGVAREGAPCAAAFGLAADSFSDTAVEALDETVGLRPVRSGQAVINLVVGADQIERVLAGRPARRLVLHIDGKAVGELGAVIGQDSVNAIWEVGQESPEKAKDVQ